MGVNLNFCFQLSKFNNLLYHGLFLIKPYNLSLVSLEELSILCFFILVLLLKVYCIKKVKFLVLGFI